MRKLFSLITFVTSFAVISSCFAYHGQDDDGFGGAGQSVPQGASFPVTELGFGGSHHSTSLKNDDGFGGAGQSVPHNSLLDSLIFADPSKALMRDDSYSSDDDSDDGNDTATVEFREKKASFAEAKRKMTWSYKSLVFAKKTFAIAKTVVTTVATVLAVAAKSFYSSWFA